LSWGANPDDSGVDVLVNVSAPGTDGTRRGFMTIGRRYGSCFWAGCCDNLTRPNRGGGNCTERTFENCNGTKTAFPFNSSCCCSQSVSRSFLHLSRACLGKSSPCFVQSLNQKPFFLCQAKRSHVTGGAVLTTQRAGSATPLATAALEASRCVFCSHIHVSCVSRACLDKRTPN
jgi:hypothetical protein